MNGDVEGLELVKLLAGGLHSNITDLSMRIYFHGD